MIKKYTKIGVNESGRFTFSDIKGKILKIVINVSKFSEGTTLKFYSQDAEIIAETHLKNNIQLIYPMNNLIEQNRQDYFYNYGAIGLEIENLEFPIEAISIIYEQ